MGAPLPAELPRVLAALERHLLLMDSDRTFPSVVGLVVGGAIRGSWWAHPKGKEIFNVGMALHDHPDVLVAKLLDGKVTYVHRALWRPLVAVGRGRAPWQLDGLPAAASTLLARVSKEGALRSEGAAAAELERRLLVHADSEHTESGAHARRLETWEHWMRRRRFALGAVELLAACALLESTVAAVNASSGATARLPWEVTRAARIRRSSTRSPRRSR